MFIIYIRLSSLIILDEFNLNFDFTTTVDRFYLSSAINNATCHIVFVTYKTFYFSCKLQIKLFNTLV